jgi:phosphohistidine phosphatase
MRVILFRHGPAARRDTERWPDDSARPLTSLGARLTRAAAEGLARIETDIEQIVSSPFARTRQTARVLADVLDTGEIEEMEALRPEGPTADILQFLSAWVSDRSLVLVGHEPSLGILAGVLLFGSPAGLPLKKAGACSIRFDGAPREGAGRLSWFLPPRLLRYSATRKRPA